jgi:hypothetical protein
MSSVSKPLLGVLAAVVIVAVLWTVALSPGGGNAGAGSSGSLGSYQGDINKARASAAAQDAAAAAANGPSAGASAPAGSVSASASAGSASASAPAGSVSASAPAGSVSASAPAGSVSAEPHAGRASAKRQAASGHAATRALGPTGSGGPAAVDSALRAGHVVALVFYNPASADDQAVRAELDSIPSSPRLLRLAVPISQVADYPAISLSVPIQSTPTLVIVNARRQATVITGFVSRFVIAARIRAALSAAAG